MRYFKTARYAVVFLAGIFPFPVFSAVQFNKISAVSSGIFRIAVSSQGTTVFVSSSSELFRSRDGGKSWERIFVTKSNPINYLALDGREGERLFLVTAYGLYVSRNAGDDFLKIYRPAAEGEGTEELLCLAAGEEKVYLGTTSGLYFCRRGEYEWSKVRSIPPRTEVNYILALRRKVIAATAKGIYQKEKGAGRFERFFAVPSSDSGDAYSRRRPLCLVYAEGRLYVGTPAGLYCAGGGRLRKMAASLPPAKVNSLSYDSQASRLYIATDKGLYFFNLRDKSAGLLYQGISRRRIRDVAVSRNKIWAAAGGLFVSVEMPFKGGSVSGNRCFLLPAVGEVQEAALKYNAVHPDKIRKWRKALKYRALMPTLNLSYDKSIYGTAGTSTYNGKAFVGPRDWSVSLSWDIGDLVWSSYEDDIDTRARLDTQLRLDILDDVNRVYFERKRLEMKLNDDTHPLAAREKAEIRMRIEELTATLDGYTGGFFSRRLQEIRKGRN